MSNILITGGTGSFGKEFTKLLLKKEAFDKIIIYSRDEHKQEQMASELNGHESLRFFIGDVRDKDRLRLALQECTHVVHAAALKVVPTGEYNPIEFIKTNIDGARNLVEIMCEQGRTFGRVIALSTDKAVAPINLYGATKLCMEKLVIAANNLVGRKDIKFNVVRYGNVANSNGSVIPKFKECWLTSDRFPVTDTRMTRFWITLDEAVEFVFNRLNTVDTGNVYIPDMPSFNILDLVGAFQNGNVYDCDFTVIGVRPGEKIHEQIDINRFSNTNDTWLDREALRKKLIELGVVDG